MRTGHRSQNRILDPDSVQLMNRYIKAAYYTEKDRSPERSRALKKLRRSRLQPATFRIDVASVIIFCLPSLPAFTGTCRLTRRNIQVSAKTTYQFSYLFFVSRTLDKKGAGQTCPSVRISQGRTTLPYRSALSRFFFKKSPTGQETLPAMAHRVLNRLGGAINKRIMIILG